MNYTEIFSVYDTAAARFLEPFFAPTVQFALRGFQQAINTPEHQFNLFPHDYTLYHIGSFDPEKGVIMSEDPRSLGVAATLIQHQELSTNGA